MNGCKVAILGFMDSQVHGVLASMLLEKFQEIESEEATFKPQIYMMTNDSTDEIKNFIKKNGIEEFNLILSIGQQITKALAELYKKKKIKNVQTLFLGADSPVEHGIVKSLQKPGSCMSGVFGSMPSASHHAEIIAFLKPFLPKILIPYDPTSLGGLLESYTSQFVEELAMRGVQASAFPVASKEEAIDVINNHIQDNHAVLLMVGCKIREIAPQVSYYCKLADRVFLSSDGEWGLETGTPFSYGDRTSALIPALFEMIKRYWIGRVSPGDQPVIKVPDSSTLYVNRCVLPAGIPLSLLRKLLIDPRFVIVFDWVGCPTAIGKERIYEKKLI